MNTVNRSEWQAAMIGLAEAKDVMARIERQLMRVSPFTNSTLIVNRAADIAAKHIGAKRELVLTKRRDSKTADARALMIHILSECAMMHDGDISTATGCHVSTCWTARRKIREMIDTDKRFAGKVEEAVKDFTAFGPTQEDMFGFNHEAQQ